jgi:hypothetical protein
VRRLRRVDLQPPGAIRPVRGCVNQVASAPPRALVGVPVRDGSSHRLGTCTSPWCRGRPLGATSGEQRPSGRRTRSSTERGETTSPAPLDCGIESMTINVCWSRRR